MRVSEAAYKVLRDTGNYAVMTGDDGLCHLIADELGWKDQSPETPARIISALRRTPGELKKRYTRDGRNRRVCIFRLPFVSCVQTARGIADGPWDWMARVGEDTPDFDDITLRNLTLWSLPDAFGDFFTSWEEMIVL